MTETFEDVQVQLDKLQLMRDALAAETERIETEYGITFEDAVDEIKQFARDQLAVGEFIQGEWLEVFLNDGKTTTNNEGVNLLIKASPLLELILKKKGDPFPSIRTIDKNRHSETGDRQ